MGISKVKGVGGRIFQEKEGLDERKTEERRKREREKREERTDAV